jgi:RND family efflux transporter MFP subunit
MNKNWPLWLRWKLPYLAMMGFGFMLFSVLGRANPPVYAPVIEPPQSDYASNISGIGVIEPKSEIVNIGVEIAGIVRDVPVKVGDNVAKDDVLFVLDQREIDAHILTLERSLESAKIQAADANAQFATVRGIGDTQAVSRDDFNRRKFAKDLAIARIEEIKAQLNQAKVTKERLTIRSPNDAQILEINVRAGEFANIGTPTQPLMRIGDVTTLYVRVEIDEENAPYINPNSSAQGVLRGNTTQKIPLRFVRFEPYIKPKQNLAVTGQRVDTRVLQVIYALPQTIQSVFVGGQMDVFIDNQKPRTQEE